MLVDRTVFEIDYLPSRVLHHDSEMSELLRLLSDSDALLHGPSGGETPYCLDVH